MTKCAFEIAQELQIQSRLFFIIDVAGTCFLPNFCVLLLHHIALSHTKPDSNNVDKVSSNEDKRDMIYTEDFEYISESNNQS